MWIGLKVVAVLHLKEIFSPRQAKKECLEVYGTDDEKHPGVDYVCKMASISKW